MVDIRMRFVTPARKIVQSGGMVVKNVAGLDMAKLMIGSFGTLAAIVVVNFKLQPMPEAERTILLSFAELKLLSRPALVCWRACSSPPPSTCSIRPPPFTAAPPGFSPCAPPKRDRPPSTVINANWPRSASRRRSRASPTKNSGAGWKISRRASTAHPDGAVVRVSSTLMDLEKCMAPLAVPAVARAGSGVCYLYFDETGAAARYLADAAGLSLKAVIEFAPEARKSQLELWPCPVADFEIMRRLKTLVSDSSNVLNRGRLYHRL